VVAGACGQHDVAGLDAFERDRSDVGVEAVAAQASRDDRHGLPGGYELELVLDGVDDGAVGCGGSVGSGVDAPVRVPGRIRQPGDRFVGNVVEGDRFLPS
jgi:hypothetical protein